MHRLTRTWLLLVAVALATGLGRAQTPSALPIGARTAALADKVPLDPELTMGTLPNGLRYYVRVNKTPERKADLRLVVKAGSILEDDQQQGLAHFVEHMAFNGTEHFPKQEIITFLSSLGVGIGADANAATGFDQTMYKLRVPADQLPAIDRSLLILEDWARKVSFDPESVSHERAVIMEEWRQGRGAAARIQDQQFPILFNGSRYADRSPIGKPEIIQAATAGQLRKFYDDWYRPDLMAVIAVGDFDPRAVENLIKAHFTPLRGPAAPRPRPMPPVPDHPGTAYSIVTDREMTAASVAVDSLLPPRDQSTIGGYRLMLVDRLFSAMLTARFSELTQQPDPPFVAAFVQRGVSIARGRDQASLTAIVKEEGIERGLDALVTEAERVSRFGFTLVELDRQRQTELRGFERVVAQRENRDSASRADEYTRNFMNDEALPSLEYEYALQQRFQPGVTLEEVNRLAKEWFPDRDRVVMVTAPEKAGLAVPDRTRLAAVVRAAGSKALTPLRDAAAAKPLLASAPQPGTVVKAETVGATGVIEWELSNGARVVLKPTSLKADEVLFRASRPGGTSLASDADYIPATAAAQVVAEGGLGQLSVIELRNALTGKVASASPFFSEVDEGLAGGGSPKDLETLFQLIYLRFTQPRVDPALFAITKAQVKSLLANQAASPDFLFDQTLASALSQDHPRRRLSMPSTVDAWNLETSLAFYRARFGDASGFRFIFVGSFDPAAIKPLVERYLASLPSTRRPETWRDVGVRPPAGTVERTVAKGVEPKSQVAIVFTGPFEYDAPHRAALRALGLVLQSRLVGAIRGELGGTYSVSVTQNAEKIPAPAYSIAIEFGCDPARTEDLVKRVFDEITFVQNMRLTETGMGQVRDALIREFQTNSRENNYVLRQMAESYQDGEDVAQVWSQDEQFRQLSGADLERAARTYLNNYVRVTLVPEQK